LIYASGSATTNIPHPSRLGRVLRFCALSLFFTGVGYIMASAPAISTINGVLNPPSDAETLDMFSAGDEESRQIERYIQNHPLARSIRANPDFSESRPHLKVPEELRVHNFTGGTLAGPRRIVVPPVIWSEKGGKSLVSICFLGEDLCGHPGIVHGGLLATLLDEGLAFCCFPALPSRIAMTANLNVNYRKPAPAGRYYVLRANTVKVEGRKAWVEGRIETLEEEGKEPIVVTEASALYIEPKQAAVSFVLFMAARFV
ncbi:MAG: Aminomethyltransferase, mitochondrial, partial [Watsoniomyces obsoletus]